MNRTTRIRDFWLDGVDVRGVPNEACMARWFGGGSEVDDSIRSRFSVDVERALDGDFDFWADSVESRFSLVVLLDQFPRNLFRGTARAFAGDPRALALARSCVESGAHLAHPVIERYFLYLPFEHAEDRSEQERSVALYETLVTDAPPDARAHLEAALDFAVRHRVVIDRFGRFPSRNAALGRQSTPEEALYLEENPTGF